MSGHNYEFIILGRLARYWVNSAGTDESIIFDGVAVHTASGEVSPLPRSGLEGNICAIRMCP